MSTTCAICAARPTAAGRLICAPCQQNISDDLGAAAAAYAWIGETMTALRPAWSAGGRRGVSVDAPAPMPLGYADARERIERTLAYWTAAALEAAPSPWPPETTVPEMTRYLRTRLDWISQTPGVRQFARSIGQLVAHARTIAPWEQGRRDLPTPCPDCRRLTLTLYHGAQTITCRTPHCNTTLTLPAYRVLVTKDRE